MNRNILCVIEGVNFGGQQLMLYNIFKQFKKLDCEGKLNVDLVYLFNDSESSIILEKYSKVFRDVKCLNFPSRSKSFYLKRPYTALKKIISFLKLLRTHKYEIVMSNGFNSAMVTSFIKNFHHGFFHYRFIGGDLSINESFSFGIFYRFLGLYKNVDLFLSWPEVLSYLQKKNIHVNTIQGFDIILHVDCSLFRPTDVKELRVKLGISESCCVIGWIGRIDKDPDSLAINETLELCKYLSKWYPDFEFIFLVVGDGSNKVNFIENVKANDLSDNVIILPSMNQDDLVRYYNVIDIEVLLDSDPQGGSHLREAMACGRVALSVNGLSGVQCRLIKDSITGVLVNSENRIEAAAKRVVSLTPEQRYEIGKNAISFISQYSYDSMSKLLFDRILTDLY